MDQSHSGLKRRIDQVMAGYSGEYAFYCNDMKSVVSKDDDLVYETASCIKSFILLALAKEVEDGVIDKDALIGIKPDHMINGSGILRALSESVTLSIEDMATLMMIVSDNIATNCIIDLLGVDRINQIICHFGFKKTRLLHHIDFDMYDDLGETTAREYGELFVGLLENKFLTSEMTEWMLDIFSKQKYQTMFTKSMAPSLLDEDYLADQPSIVIMSKSGSMDQVRNDGGIVRTPVGDYVLVMFTRNFNDHFYHAEHESYRFGSQVTNMLFNHFISGDGSLV